MCEYCEDRKTINRSNWGWGYDGLINLLLVEAEESPTNLAVFIDRGYLRLADLGDCNCIDSGVKFKIKFCPVCGELLGGI